MTEAVAREISRVARALANELEPVDQALTRILDAARDQFAHFGVRRSSIDDIAKRAGLSRNTVFRRLGSKEELVKAVVLRELRDLIGEIDEVARQGRAARAGPGERLAEAFATTVLRARSNPLMVAMLHHRPDEVLAFAALDGGLVLTVAVDYVAGVIQADQARGDVSPRVGAIGVAELVVRTLQSIVLTPHVRVPLETEAELRAFALAHLAPLLTAN
jgi:AcrR family transcriptional regulator